MLNSCSLVFLTLALLLSFVPITLLVSAYFPFTMGCKEKMEILINENEVKIDIEKLMTEIKTEFVKETIPVFFRLAVCRIQ